MSKDVHVAVVTRESIPGVLVRGIEKRQNETRRLRVLVGSRFLLCGRRGRLVLARFPRRILERSRRPKARGAIDVSVDAD